MKVQLSAELSLPIDVVTQTLLVVGKRGSGKTSTGVVLAEQFHRAKVPFVVLDVMDVWWGLKASRDGKAAGLGVHVFGGRHADLPLEHTAGALMADVLVEHRISAVLSMKHFTVGQRARFATDFARRLLERNTEPLHVFLEEAHEVAPQMPAKREKGDPGDESQMAGAINRLWKLGRNLGIGGSAITQRPASLSKNVTTQAEILIVHRTIGPQDVAAVRDWIKYHGEREDILPQLSGLKTGEAFVWGPDFPEGKPIGLRRVQIDRRTTFDSSATPKAGERRTEPKALAPVDLEALRERMAATIERAKADDPKELRRKIAELERALRGKTLSAEADPAELEKAREEGWNEGWADAVEAAQDHFERVSDRVHDVVAAAVRDFGAEPTPRRESRLAPGSRARAAPLALERRPREARPAPARPAREASDAPAAGLTRPMQAVLDAHSWLGSCGFREPFSRIQVAFVSGYSPTSSTFANLLSACRTAGLLEYPSGGSCALTEEGLRLARAPERPPDERALHERVLALLSGPQQRAMAVLFEARGAVAREDLAVRIDYSPTSSTFANLLSSLRGLRLIDYPTRGSAAASDVLFLERR